MYLADTPWKIEKYCEVRQILIDCLGEHENNNLVTEKIMLLIENERSYNEGFKNNSNS